MVNSLSIDFETYSEAGYVWDADRNRWRSLAPNAPGLKGVGAVVYSEHPSTEVICLAYGDKLWTSGMLVPTDLFNHIATGGLVSAWNSSFEYYIWKNVCVPMGWPELPYTQLRCSMAAARGWGLPGALEKAASALHTPVQKDKRGSQLITQLTQPRSPTKKDASLRRTVTTHPVEHAEFYAYCLTDVQAESGIAAVTPPLSPFESDVWLLDQKINYRGMAVDRVALEDCMAVVALATEAGTEELRRLTGEASMTIGMTAKIKGWLKGRQLDLPDLQKATVADTLATRTLTADQRRVLELRASLSATSVAKLNSLHYRTGADGRLHDYLAYCGAERTGRWAGRGPQPHNLPRGKWSAEAVDGALSVIASRDLTLVTGLLGDPIAAVSNCLRGLFVAAPGYELICSDYSAIEAVVLAALAGETWRMEVFKTHGKIYESSASKITGIPFGDFMAHKRDTGKHHPMRNLIGKVAELASGFQGGLGAWKQFGAGDFMTDEEIKRHVAAWREASPMIVKFWYGLERAAIQAVRFPGSVAGYRRIAYQCRDGVLYCKLPSGRELAYHEPELRLAKTPWGAEVTKLSFMGWESMSRQWCRIDTYGGKLTENVVQAVARDILAYGMLGLDHAGYEIVLHVHDEVVGEVPEGVGSVEQVEQIMSTMPEWCADWPIRAAGGWRGHRYRKD